jgi:hypothetical protein
MSELSPFLKRMLERLPQGGSGVTDYQFKSWTPSGKPTAECVGLLPVRGVDAQKLLGKVMDVNAYKGAIPHVVESRSIADARFAAPNQVRFYQRVNIPIIGDVHQELVLSLTGEHHGYQICAWQLLDRETEALSPKTTIRSGYSDGAWLVAPNVVGYALSSAPRREDVGFIKWKALTTGADVAASKVIRDNIAAMARWAGF